MKKLLSVMLSLLMMVSVMPVQAYAESDETQPSDGSFTYEIQDSEVTITGWNGEGDAVIPDTIEGYPVTAIRTERSTIIPD